MEWNEFCLSCLKAVKVTTNFTEFTKFNNSMPPYFDRDAFRNLDFSFFKEFCHCNIPLLVSITLESVLATF